MDPKNLKFVVDGYSEGKPAIIRFYGDVDYWSVADFNSEFVWLEEYVHPSKIIILINSAGGSVIEGMSTFSVIQNCTIPTECVIEGIAASMGSIIWAAGDRLYMHDYSILMIHNPFMSCGGERDDSESQAIEAFRAQLEMVYCKRFNMSSEQVKAIMDGEGDNDGTFFTAESAVNAGFISSSHVIATSPAIFDSIKNKIEGVKGATAICSAMAAAISDINESELLKAIESIHDKKDNSHLTNKVMNEQNELFNSVVALLGCAQGSNIASVTAEIKDLQAKAKELGELKNQLSELQIKLTGKEAEVVNLQANLDEAKAALKVFEDAKAAAFEAEVLATIEGAIKDGKITEDSKEAWVTMAHTSFETVKASLESIQARTIISQELKNNPQAAQAAQEALKTAEEKMAEKVKEVVGEMNLKTF